MATKSERFPRRSSGFVGSHFARDITDPQKENVFLDEARSPTSVTYPVVSSQTVPTLIMSTIGVALNCVRSHIGNHERCSITNATRQSCFSCSCHAVTVLLCTDLLLFTAVCGLVTRRPNGLREIQGSSPAYFRRAILVTHKRVLQRESCHTFGVVGPVLGLLGLVSISCHWMRKQV